jgi:hypothetical protein
MWQNNSYTLLVAKAGAMSPIGANANVARQAATRFACDLLRPALKDVVDWKPQGGSFALKWQHLVER